MEVEVDIGPGLPGFHMVGLPDHASKEGKERIRAAIRHQGFRFPTGRIAVNLAPATMPKRGGALDLPVAAAILASSGQVPAERLEGWALWGELAFDGRLRPLPGVLDAALGLAPHPGVRRLLVPPGCARQAAVSSALEVHEAADLAAAVRLLEDPGSSRPAPLLALAPSPCPDWSEVRGQPFALRALELAAAGGHGLLMIGPPGCGKTFLASRLADLLPDLVREEALEVARIHSAAGLLDPAAAISPRPPLRCPGPSTSREGLLGGGRPPGPGEVTLAHRGVLFLDEAAEFPRAVLDALRGPMTEGRTHIGRAQGSLRFPSRFLLVMAANPCPCGFAGEPERLCSCPPATRLRYQARLSGPLLDRLDLLVRVAPPRFDAGGEPPDVEALRARVAAARAAQATRLGPGRLNREATLTELSALLPGCGAPAALAPLAPRAARRVLAVAQTLADLDGRSAPEAGDLERALGWGLRSRGERAA